jgi:hypothetical protein
MEPSKKTARIAGILYLIVVITGIVSLGYIPKQLIVWEDKVATFNNILKNENLFRFGIFSSVICYLAFIFLPLVLRELIKTVNQFVANVMAVSVLVSIPISFFNLYNKYLILDIIHKESYLKMYSEYQLQSLVMFHLNQYEYGIFISTFFWGLWLFPFGYLVYKSGFIPKIFGILLMLGCFGYIVNFSGNTLFADYQEWGISKIIGKIPSVAEIGICFWLLVFGIKNSKNKEYEK